MIDGQGQLITSKGYWYRISHYVLRSGKIEGFASPNELAPLTPHLPLTESRQMQTEIFASRTDAVGNIPIDVAAPMVRKLAKLEQDIDAFRRRHAATLEGLYEMLADDEELLEWKLEEVVPKAFGIPLNELSVAGRLALDRFVNQSNQGIYRETWAAITTGFYVRPRKDMQMQQQVIEWARKYQESAARAALGKDVKEDLRHNPLSAFINKAHRLILRSRKIRSPTTIGLLGPSVESGDDTAIRAVDAGETLTKHDKQIIRFIYQVSEMVPPLVASEAQSICALIFRAIGAYPNLRLGRKVAHLLLQELGVFPPWNARALNNYRLRLPGVGLFPRYERLVAKAEASCKDLTSFRMSTEPTRKEWAQMPVYCIDDVDTMECDDGISIEPATNMPDCAWVHVHIANPAAYISCDHPIAAAAVETFQTLYTSVRKYALMPSRFVQNLSSLAANRPVMTVSTLLQADGSVVEIELSLGMVRNVIRLTPSAVEAALTGKKKEKATIVIGGARPAPEDDAKELQKAKQALPDLVLLNRYIDARNRKRLAEWPVEELAPSCRMTPRMNVWTNLKEDHVPLSCDKISHWKGDPIIAIEADRFPRTEDSSDDMALVELAMLLAGESAAKWCKDREIPIFYHAAIPHPLFPISKLVQLAANDYRILPIGRMSVSPLPHWNTMMRQYTRITSPLRRYPDLLNQWQIQGYLQAKSRESQDSKDSDVKPCDPLSELPFTRQELEGMVKPLHNKIQPLKRVGAADSHHYLHQALFRAFHFKEADLPKVWDLQVIGPRRPHDSPGATGIYGFLVPFPAVAELVVSPEKWENTVGRSQFLPVQIQTVDAEQSVIIVKAVGPPSDSPTNTDPVHIQSFKKQVSPGGHGPDQSQC
jgi:RNB domain